MVIIVIDGRYMNNIIGIYFDNNLLLAGVQQGSFLVSLLYVDPCGGNDLVYSPP